jgi:hypothetical protein
MKSQKIENNHSKRHVSSRTRRVTRKPAMKRLTHPAGTQVVGVLLAEKGADPKTIANAIAEITTDFAWIVGNSTVQTIGGDRMPTGQIVLVMFDEQLTKPQVVAPSSQPANKPQVASPPTNANVIVREEVIATD